MNDPYVMIPVVGLVIYSITLHELAHAWVATWCGDPTPGRHGRLTWNPIKQLDPIYSVVLPILTYILNGFPMGFAYCPIQPSYFRKPLRDRALVAVAGPLTNVVVSGFFLLMMYIPQITPYDAVKGVPSFNFEVFLQVSRYNLLLAVFNMLPLWPLDGFDVFRVFLPGSLRRQVDQIQNAGFAVMMMVVMVVGGYLMQVIAPVVMAGYRELLPDRPPFISFY